jgi:hypothetical protein
MEAIRFSETSMDLYRGILIHKIPHFLDNQLTDGGEAVRLTRRTPCIPRKIPGTHFCLRLSRPQGHSAAGRIRSIVKSNDLIGMDMACRM